MKVTKLLLAVLLTSLIGLSSCAPTATENVDPKIGTWKAENVSVSFGGLTAMADITMTYSADKSLVISVMGAGTTVSLATLNAVWNKNVGESVDLYETKSATAGGVSSPITDPFFKIKNVINGSSGSISWYESSATVAAAEAQTTVAQSFTVTKQ